MLLAYLCSVVMVAFILDSKLLIHHHTKPSQLTSYSVTIRPRKALLERPNDRPLPQVPDRKHVNHWILRGQPTDLTAEQSRRSNPLLRCHRSRQRQHLAILPSHLPRPIHHDSRLESIRLCHGLLDRRSFRQHLQLQSSQCQLGA